MNALVENLNVWGAQAMKFAWPMFWQSSLLILALFAVDRALQRKVRAGVRYALWLVVLVKLVLPPSLALPTGVGWWVRSSSAPSQPKLSTISSTITYVPVASLKVMPEAPVVSMPPRRTRISGHGGMALVWGSVGTVLLFWMLARVRMVIREGRGANPPRWLEELLLCAQKQARLRRNVRLRLVEERISPAVCGLLRPLILLPRLLAERLAPERLRGVLLHELLHLKRGDVWLNSAQALLQIVYWWHPLVWLANARIRRLREEAVDDAVIIALGEAAENYAPTLLEVARFALRPSRASLGLVGILESRQALRKRIKRLIELRPPKRVGLSASAALAIVAFAAVAVPMGEGPPKAVKVAFSPETAVAPWPDARFGGYKTIDLDAQFFVGESAALRTVLPSLLEAGAPLIVNSNELPELMHKLSESGARKHAWGEAVQFQKFSGGRFHWKIGESTNNVVNYQTAQVGERAMVLGAEVELTAVEADWTPLDFVLVPWAEPDSIRCEMELGVGFNANLGQHSSALLPPGGAALWAVAVETNRGRSQLVLLRNNTAAGEQSLPTIETSTAPQTNATDFAALREWLSTSALVNEAKLLYETGKLDLAKGKLRQALDQDPGNQTAAYYLARVAEAEGERDVQRHVKGHQQDARALGFDWYLGNVLMNKGSMGFQILNKLRQIRLPSISWDGLPLKQVLEKLSEESRKNDPELRGVEFRINNDIDSSSVDPITGLPATGNSFASGQPDRMAAAETDLGFCIVKIMPPLVDIRLLDVLDAIVKVASKPIQYSLADDAVLFSHRGEAPTPLYVRVMKLDPTNLMQNLQITEPGTTNALRGVLENIGFDLRPPQSVFYSFGKATLVVRAPLVTLDKIEAEVQRLNMPPGGQQAMPEVAGSVNLHGEADKVPVLGDVPFVGRLFRTNAEQFRQTAQKSGSSENAPLVIAIDSTGSLRMGAEAKPVTLERLKTELFQAMAAKPDLKIAISADKSAPVGQFIKVLDISREAKVKIKLITKEPPAPPTSTNLMVKDYTTGDAKLSVRVIKIDTNAVFPHLRKEANLPEGAAVEAQFRQYFSKRGVFLEPPKALSFDARTGALVINATEQELDGIEAALQAIKQVQVPSRRE